MIQPPMITGCPERVRLRQLLDRQLPDDQVQSLQAHLRQCPPCRQVLEQLRGELTPGIAGHGTDVPGDTKPSSSPLGSRPSAPGCRALENDSETRDYPTQQLSGSPTQNEDAWPTVTFSDAPSPPVDASNSSATNSGSRPVDHGEPATSAQQTAAVKGRPVNVDFLRPAVEPGELGRLATYRVLKVLGVGGMGMVFEAEDTGLQRRVALKVLRAELAADTNFRERFLREARAAAALAHDNIVTIFQVGEDNDVPFLAMQFLQGETLESRLARKPPLSLVDALRIGREIAEGLQVAHAHGLIHRDIKPANIWLEAADAAGTFKRVRLLDFGLARRTGGTSRLTEAGMIIGTPGYMSPEQARGLQLDARSDLFSLGCVLYNMLTGALPFDGPDTLAVLAALAVDPARPVGQLKPDLPLPLAQLVDRLLAKKAEDRPASAQVVIEHLRALEQGRTPSVSLTPAPGQIAPLPAGPLPAGGGPPVPGRSWRWLIATALALLLGGAVYFGNRPYPTRAPIVPAAGPPIKIGVLHSLSGTMRQSESPVVDATLLAIGEINERGGVLGRKLEPVVADGESVPRRFAEQCQKLIAEDQVAVVFGCWTSSSRKQVRPVVEKLNHLLVYPVQHEGLEQSPNIVYTGATPNQQIIPAVEYAIGNLEKQRLFLVGSDYVFPRTANAIIRDVVQKHPGVQIVGEEYLPLGSVEVDRVIKAILASKPDLILNTINGDSNTAFFRELRVMGVASAKTPTMSFSIGENEVRSLDVGAIAGDYAAWNYFQSIDSPENQAFVKKFQARFGPSRVTSDPMDAAYFGVHLWAQAATKAGSVEPQAVREALKGQSIRAPGGNVHIDPVTLHTAKTVRLGQIAADGRFEILWLSGKPIQPEPFPATRSRGEWEAFLQKLFTDWGGSWEKPRG
jgi:urea transport system substrate-binding protein